MNLDTVIREGDLPAVQSAWRAGLRKVDSAPTPLLMAIYHGQARVADWLRQQKPLDGFEAAALGDLHRLGELWESDEHLPHAVSNDGFTALGLACYFGHLEAVRWLLEKGSDPNFVSRNPLAVRPIHSALAGQHKAMVRLLVEFGAHPGAPNGDGWTPLHYCAENNDVETAEFLLEHGAERNVFRADGKSPSQIAAEKGHRALATLLMVG